MHIAQLTYCRSVDHDCVIDLKSDVSMRGSNFIFKHNFKMTIHIVTARNKSIYSWKWMNVCIPLLLTRLQWNFHSCPRTQKLLNYYYLCTQFCSKSKGLWSTTLSQCGLVTSCHCNARIQPVFYKCNNFKKSYNFFIYES